MKKIKMRLCRHLVVCLFVTTAFIALPSSQRPNLWGVHITPELLKEHGMLDVNYPSEKFSPEGAWEQTWRIWLPGRGGPNNKSGYLKLGRNPGADQEGLDYEVQQLISEDNSWAHLTEAKIQAHNDSWGTPVRWEKSTRYHTSASDGSRNIEEISSYQKDSLKNLSLSESGQVATSFTIIDAIQRMSVGNVSQLDFTLLDELDKVKENHSVSFLEETSIYFAGKSRNVRCYVEFGDGMLPWKYYVSKEGRLLLAISGMRTYILDPDCEKSYQLAFETKEDLPGKTQAEVVQISVPGEGAKPNILFITTDQQTWNTLSELGNKYVNTPNLDRLAKGGVSFRKSYSPNPVCSPTRACWLTGLTSSENGVIKNGLSIIENIETVGDVLTGQGYETVFAGKLHVGIPNSYGQKIPGFSKVLCAGIGGKGTLGDQVVSSVCEGYLQNRDKSQPFFMSVNFLQPHDVCNWTTRNKEDMRVVPKLDWIADKLPPLPENFNTIITEPAGMGVTRWMQWNEQNWRYYLWSYYRMIEEVDAEIGRILSALEESGESGNTVILFNSDHGEGAAHHQSILKDFLYDEASRVPFIIYYPEELKQGVLDGEHLVSGLDIVPTICDFAGAEPPSGYKGLSVRRIAAGKKDKWREFVVSEVESDQGRMIRSSDYKLIAFRDDPDLLFFDMKNDPGETVNLASDKDYQALIDEHINLLEEWESKLNYAPNVSGLFTVKRD